MKTNNETCQREYLILATISMCIAVVSLQKVHKGTQLYISQQLASAFVSFSVNEVDNSPIREYT